MKIDVHFHAVGSGNDLSDINNDIYYSRLLRNSDNCFTNLLIKTVQNMVEKSLEKQIFGCKKKKTVTAEDYFGLAYKLLISSKEIDGIVLLGLDAVYSSKTGDLNEKKTELYVSNRFLNNKVMELNERLQKEADFQKANKRFYFGASVNPNRKDWESELDYVLSQTNAVLVKWIPSVQHIQVADKKHKEFYDALSLYNMPLLCHVGPEYSFSEGRTQKSLDNFRYLENPLERGVRIIAAHCSTPVFPFVDKNEIEEFYTFMKNANRGKNVQLWADTSALSLSSRIFMIPEIVKTFPSRWLIHGSDFPIPIDGRPHIPWLTYKISLKKYIQIIKTKNLLDKDVRIKRAHGFSDIILENAEKVLRFSVK